MSAKNRLYKIICLGLFLYPAFISAQSFRLTHLTTHDGLPIDNVYAAAQDDNGFIWFGTDFGIARYDGYRFTTYDKKNGMANKAVTDIVYAGGDSLIFCSYPTTLQVIHKDGHIKTLIENTGLALHQLTRHNGQFYFYKRTDANFGIWEKGKYSIFKTDRFFTQKEILLNSIVSLEENGVAFCTSKGLFIQKGLQLMTYLPGQNVQFAVYTGKKTILAVVNGKLVRSDQAFTFKELPFQFPKDFIVYHAVEDKTGNFWFRGLDKGLYRFNENELMDFTDRVGMESKAMNEFFADADGNLWFCTDGNGVLLKKNSAFYNYETVDGLVNNKILHLLKQDDGLLIGTSNGLSVLNHNKIATIKLPKTGTALQYTYQLFPVADKVTGICIEQTFQFSVDTNSIERLEKQLRLGQYTFKAFNAQFAWQENDQTAWMLIKKTLIRLQKGNRNKLTIDLSAFGLKKGYCMIGFENKYWLGTDAGIILIDKGKISVTDSIAGRKIKQVFNFLKDSKGLLWIATDNGVFVYKYNQFTFKNISPSTAGNYCTGLTEDDQDRIWVSTWDGIFMLDGDVQVPFNTNDGLPSKTANCILFDTAEQQLYVGTDNGLGVLRKTRFVNNSSDRKIFINCNLTGNGERMLSDGSRLQPDENNLNFYLSFPYYQEISKVLYEYRLDEGKWISTINPVINISDIGSGEHRFYARAKVNDNIVSTAETGFSFSVKNPFYKTWWFWLIGILLLQFFIFRIINHYNKKAKEKKLTAELQNAEYASLKQQAFTSLMNPHFIFNALNSVQHYINKQDRQSANKYLSNFAALIRRSFEAAQKSFVTLEEELETMRLYLELEKMRFADKFEYRFNVSKEAEEDDWMLPSMMLQPFLENAVLHGLISMDIKGLLTIDVTTENNALKVIITDNGIGMEKSKALRREGKHNSKGMLLINERIGILSKLGKEPITLTITPLDIHAQNPGTKVTLIIPQEVYEVYQQQKNPS
ncbi:MAG: histidine kinase [Chitinophagaceae bacterium]|nr:histidine kinase [Chitinophagaceae bacterium]